MWKLISENAFLGALISGLLIMAIVGICRYFINLFEAHNVFKALESGLQKKNCTFLPSSYLAAQTNYTQAKVEQLCSLHKNIKRNEKDLESWQIIK